MDRYETPEMKIERLEQKIEDLKACIHDIHDEYSARLFKKQMMLVAPALVIAMTLMLCFGGK